MVIFEKIKFASPGSQEKKFASWVIFCLPYKYRMAVVYVEIFFQRRCLYVKLHWKGENESSCKRVVWQYQFLTFLLCCTRKHFAYLYTINASIAHLVWRGSCRLRCKPYTSRQRIFNSCHNSGKLTLYASSQLQSFLQHTSYILLYDRIYVTFSAAACRSAELKHR